MLLKRPVKKEQVKFKGAIQFNHNSYFVYVAENGRTFLKTGRDEKLQKSILKDMIEKNPLVKKILDNYKIKPSVDTKILRELSGGHMNETCNIAIGIYTFLPESLKPEIDLDALKEAAMLHDVGKVLIPSKILNKPAKLNNKERKIMNIHSTLGYELLKTQNISEETLDLIKYHHQNLKHSGYPDWEGTILSSDVAVQIISISDKYSALREARVYRRKLTRIESLLILYKEVREGKILPTVYDALVEYAKEFDN